ncbi:hypothetical protein HZS_6682 [Henneguya salminicola]|nr:hypothetical protein HZS_6682 [Henneguya salminicola]
MIRIKNIEYKYFGIISGFHCCLVYRINFVAILPVSL